MIQNKINELKAGQTFKDYTSLCHYLDEPVLQSNSKTAQLKRWRTLFSWINDGRAFVITNVFTDAAVITPEQVIINGFTYHRGRPVGGADDE